ncbi:hypothetical protein HN709_00220 [Candidatus Peregrinibacteria bacterium]|nr:hypothetical protein [Candidatus Peregrinibacteria bacterium]MBT7736096.1 hypothetical protein [Candidatus Peregrinibacteria bacterium]
MKPKIGEKLEGYDPTIPAENQTVMFGNVKLTATNQRTSTVLWEFIPPESKVVPIRPNSPDIPHRAILGISVLTRGGIIRSIRRFPIKDYS